MVSLAIGGGTDKTNYKSAVSVDSTTMSFESGAGDFFRICDPLKLGVSVYQYVCMYVCGAWQVVRNDFDRNVKSQTLKCQNVIK